MTAFILQTDNARARMRAAWEFACRILELGKPARVTVEEAKGSKKSREQEEKYHAIINEIAATERLHGKKLPPESWKRLLIDAFKHETKDDPTLRDEWAKFGSVELLPALNHPGFVMVGNQSRKFTVKLASAFIDWLEAFQADPS